jgi:Flp pilus assembly pilin Flp
MNCCKRFLKDEDGAVTVDWVVLTSGLAILAIIALTPIQAGVSQVASDIGDFIGVYGTFFD